MLAREDGRLRVVLHVEHQRQCAAIAAAWGNDRVPAPPPGAAEAIAVHDGGWRAWDARPQLDPRTGRPFQFLDVAGALVRGHATGVREASARDPYVGLLVSMHVCGVLGSRCGWDPGVTGAALVRRVRRVRGAGEALAFGLARERFLLAQRRHRGRLRAALGGVAPEPLWRAYDVMQAWDELSLHFGTGGATRTIGPPPARGGRPPSLPRLRVRTTAPRTATLAPWPFAAERVELPLAARFLADRPYRDTDDFIAAWRAAADHTLTFALHPA
ncbi:MAG TPA: DUF3891 family protein [Conexibacter sp.]|nr:DUF3891 family protein [Conexibacter sp.]